MTAPVSRQIFPVAAWPEIDRRLWESGLAGAYVATISPGAVALSKEGYGRWISMLASHGLLDARMHPGDRVTPDAVQGYTDQLREAGNKNRTIAVRLSGLGGALRIMVPERSFTWLHMSRQPLLRSGRKRSRMMRIN